MRDAIKNATKMERDRIETLIFKVKLMPRAVGQAKTIAALENALSNVKLALEVMGDENPPEREQAPRGVRRIINGWQNDDSVVVKYEGGNEMHMNATWYEERGYEPALRQLPWCG